MQALNNINFDSLIDTFVSLSAAFILGGLISSGNTASVPPACAPMCWWRWGGDLRRHGQRLGGVEGAVRVVAYVVSGIGFLGAG
ncbi:Mg(2+)-transport-ATPase-associated protein MgtC [Pseudomonas sp. FEN]|nr:Mg(2+)-transport-ATPase-associated protein MgtC [Pseudomonas sp. FEN]